jgi:L-iditol 2-dehydrogenase
VRIGDTVVVVGPGPIGLLIVQVAKACGAKRVVNTGTRDNRLELAKKLGADEVVNIKHEDVVDIVSQITNGVMADIVIEAAGTSSAAVQSLKLAKRKGVVTLVGVYPKPFEADFNDIVRRELQVRGSWSSGVFTDWELALKLLSSKKVQTTPLITHKLPLEKWEEAVKLEQERKAMKVLFNP